MSGIFFLTIFIYIIAFAYFRKFISIKESTDFPEISFSYFKISFFYFLSICLFIGFFIDINLLTYSLIDLIYYFWIGYFLSIVTRFYENKIGMLVKLDNKDVEDNAYKIIIQEIVYFIIWPISVISFLFRVLKFKFSF